MDIDKIIAIFKNDALDLDTVSNIDIMITCEKPKLEKYIIQMRGSIAIILGIDIDKVSIKAGTNEGFDAIGQGQAIVAETVILLEGVKNV